jgi:nucleotide-binding universal stress UspA family protein
VQDQHLDRSDANAAPSYASLRARSYENADQAGFRELAQVVLLRGDAMSTEKWILGLDLKEGAEGPLVFADWLSTQLGAMQPVVLEPIHAIERDDIVLLTNDDKREQVVSLAEDAVARTLRRAGVTNGITNTRLVEVGEPEDVLARAAREADGLIIGRLAPRGKDRLLRLGSVARRLLRTLAAPTLVVPPDLHFQQIGKGPIILACDLHDDSIGATRFALRMADRLHRELMLVHVVPMPYGWSVGYLSPDLLTRVYADLEAQGERLLERWAQKQGISGLRQVACEGMVADELTKLSRQEDALMLVAGSRKLNALERLFVASVGSELAASASCPVAVVPSDYGS